MKEAVLAVINKELNIRKAAEIYDISKSALQQNTIINKLSSAEEVRNNSLLQYS